MPKAIDENDPNWLWKRNVRDDFKYKTNEEIKEELCRTALPCAVLVQNIQGDFNLGAIMRSANAFGIHKFFYYGKKRFDRRACIGSQNYCDLNFFSTLDEVKSLKSQYHFVGLENNIERKSHDMMKYNWKPNTLFVIGEESIGLTNDMMDVCDELVEIVLKGSIRSLNAGCAASLAFYDYSSKL
jgi:tRNA G18 (ribose-2'-O)-methylase SpoU